VPDRVEAEGAEAKLFVSALRDILKVPKSEVNAKLLATSKTRERKRERQSKKVSTISTRKG
jgi:hypothetical protein